MSGAARRSGACRRLPALALLGALVSACGSTAQLGGPGAVALPTGDGLSTVVDAGPATGLAPAATGGAPGALSPGAPGPTGAAGPGPSGVPTTGGAQTSTAPRAGAATDRSPVKVGFFVVKDLGPATKALGVDGLATGDGANQARASVALLNARGGLAGRRVQPVIVEIDATGDVPSQTQAACSTFFEDNKVRAVVTSLLLPALQACVGQKGVPLLASGNRTTSSKDYARTPLLVAGPQLALDRVVPLQVAALARQGWLTGTSRVGLIYNDDLDYAGVPDLVGRELAARGLPALLDRQAMPGTDDTSRVTAATSAGQNAVLRFASARIDRVLVVDKSGQAIAYFGIAAQNQGYFPGYGISSLQLPNVLRTVLSARQLDNARGIGWSPGVDLPVATQQTMSANHRACLDALGKAGEDMGSAATRFSALGTCDGALLLGAAWTDPTLNPASFLPGLRALGARYSTVLTFASDFSRRNDGASRYRDLAFNPGCDCFAYSGSLQPAP